MGVHKTWIGPNGDVPPSAFQNRGDGMSTDWSRYSTPEQTRDRRRQPSENLVVRMNVGRVRQVPGQQVEHSPLPKNRAHTNVTGDKDPESRVKLRRIAEIILTLPPE